MGDQVSTEEREVQTERKTGNGRSILEQLEDPDEKVATALVKKEKVGQVFVVDGEQYRHISLLGNTNTGHTFLVEGPHGKEVLKMLNCRLPPGDDVAEQAKSIELFSRQVKVLSKLDHEQIPKVGIQFALEDNFGGQALFFTQEYINAPNLGKVITEEGTLEPRKAVRIIQSALDPIEYCHQQEPDAVIHRDIKPENILWDGEKSHLVDFGAVLDEKVGTVGGDTTVGTAGYMAPEQRIGQATEQSDIYGLGATLLEMVTGKKPAEMSNEHATSFEERFKLDYEDYVQDLDEKLQEMFERTLAFDPEDRYESIAEFREELEDYLAPAPKVIVQQVVQPKKKKVFGEVLGWLFLGGLVGSFGMFLHYLVSHSHRVDSGEVAVLVDDHGNVRLDSSHGYNQFHGETHFEYKEIGNIPIRTEVTRSYQDRNTVTYPIQGYLKYVIEDPVAVHLTFGQKSEEGLVGEEQLKADIHASVRHYIEKAFAGRDIANFERKIDDRWSGSEPDTYGKVKGSVSSTIKDEFKRNYPTGVRFEKFDFRIGIPKKK